MTKPANSNLDARQLELLLRRLKQKGAVAASPAVSVIPHADRTQAIPVSLAQARLWFIDRLDPEGSKAYHLATAFRLEGRLQRDALIAALDAIVGRHESLRTTFAMEDGEARAVIAPAGSTFALSEEDLGALPEAARQARVDEIAAREVGDPFDLATGPLCRGRLLRLGDDEHVLLITLHHIVSDGWSIGVFASEMRELYTAFATGRDDPLPPLPVQYADFAAWQRTRLAGAALDEQIGFWRGYLEGAPAVLDLPFDRQRRDDQTFDGDVLRFEIPEQTAQGLRVFAQRGKGTLFMVLLTAWAALLSRLSGQQDLVIGTPVAGRERAELEPLIGFFANTLVLRIRIDPEATAIGLMEQVRASVTQAFAHQELQFEQIVEAVKPERSLAYNPIFQVMLAFNNTPDGGNEDLPGLRLSAIEQRQTTAHFDLMLNLTDGGDRLGGALTYRTDLFDRESIERYATYLLGLLEAMLSQPEVAVSRLAILPEA
ncbi:condensation domain-containing protein, partial [Thauera sinica]